MTAKKKPFPAPSKRAWTPAEKAQVASAALGNPTLPLLAAGAAWIGWGGARRLGNYVNGLFQRPSAPGVTVNLGGNSEETRSLFDWLRADRDAQRERDTAQDNRIADAIAAMREKSPSSSSPTASTPPTTASSSWTPTPGAGLNWRSGNPFARWADTSPAATTTQPVARSEPRIVPIFPTPTGLIGAALNGVRADQFNLTPYGAGEAGGVAGAGILGTILRPTAEAAAGGFFGFFKRAETERVDFLSTVLQRAGAPKGVSDYVADVGARPGGVPRTLFERGEGAITRRRRSRGEKAFSSYIASPQAQKDADYTAAAVKRYQSDPNYRGGF